MYLCSIVSFWISYNGLHEIQKGGVEKVKIEVALNKYSKV